MEVLKEWSYRSIKRVDTRFKRYLASEINWDARLIILVGSRGVGKTTLILQHIKDNLPHTTESLYVSLDNLYFSTHSLVGLAETFYLSGGRFLLLDEIQKYKGWSLEVKNIYDNFPELRLVLTGSSTTEILRSEGDLSRRAVFYNLGGLSFREFLQFQDKEETAGSFDAYPLTTLLKEHQNISYSISEKIRPIKEFKEYLEFGYYPFFMEDRITYHQKLRQVINTVIEVDIPSVYQVDHNAIGNMRKLLGIMAEMVPFKPNVKKLSEQVGVSRESLIRYMKYIEKAELVQLLYSQNKGIGFLNKPEKVYLNNGNISYALGSNVNVGSLRETFFLNQLKLNHKVRFSQKGDFVVDDIYTFEVGGKDKPSKQIAGMENAWIAADNIEVSIGNKIPLWLFGFLY